VRPVAYQISGACGDEDLSWSLMAQVNGAWVPVEAGQELMGRDPGQARFSEPLAANTPHRLSWTAANGPFEVTFTTGTRTTDPIGAPPLLALPDGVDLDGQLMSSSSTRVTQDSLHDADPDLLGVLRLYEANTNEVLWSGPASAEGHLEALYWDFGADRGLRCYELSHEDAAGHEEVFGDLECARGRAWFLPGCSTVGRTGGFALVWLAGLLGLVRRR